MYLINFTNKTYEEGDADFLEKKATEESINTSLFLQSTLPKNPPFWKIDGGMVVEMTEGEKDYVRAVSKYKSVKQNDFSGKRYRLEVSPIAVAEPSEMLAEVIRMLTDKDVDQNSIETPDGDLILAYFDILRPQNAGLLSDPRFAFFDVEVFNPDSELYIEPII